MGEKKLDPDSDEALLRAEVVHEWTRVERPVRERIRLRWPRLAELLDDLAASS